MSISAKSYKREFDPLPFQGDEVALRPQEKIAEAPTLEQMTEAEINALFGEDPYIGKTDWRGNKVLKKRTYSKKDTRSPF